MNLLFDASGQSTQFGHLLFVWVFLLSCAALFWLLNNGSRDP